MTDEYILQNVDSGYWSYPWIPVDADSEEMLLSELQFGGSRDIASSLSVEFDSALANDHPLKSVPPKAIAFRDTYTRGDRGREVLFSTAHDEYPLISVVFDWGQDQKELCDWNTYKDAADWLQRMRRDNAEYAQGEMAWSKVDWEEHRVVWDRFYEKFRFQPNYYERNAPAILEPKPSVVLDLAGTQFLEDMEDIDRTFLDLFKQLVDPDESLLVLDWHHSSFRFQPHLANDCNHWPTTVFPDGDYYIFLAEDFSFGTFGHPWQASLCVFGQPLVELVPDRIIKKLGVLRRSNDST